MTETVEVDICEDTIFATMTEVILDETSNVIPCTDTSEYEWKPEKICEVDVGITCETVYGTPIECNDTPLAKTSDDFTLYLKYIYTLTNVFPTTDNINSLFRTSIDIFQEETTLSVSDELDAT